MAEESSSKVQVHIYDLSMGLAAQLSPLFLGKQINGIWHTGIVVYGREYFFGGMGIQFCPPNGTVMGPAHKIEDLGETQIPKELFQEYLYDLAPKFCAQTYDLFHHNCNTFSNEIAQFLTGKSIPEYITNLPQEVLETPFGSQIKPMLDRFQGIGGPDGSIIAPPTSNSTLPQQFGGGSSANPQTSTDKSQFPEADVMRIVSNGFTRTEALEELSTCNGDADKALMKLYAKAFKF